MPLKEKHLGGVMAPQVFQLMIHAIMWVILMFLAHEVQNDSFQDL